MYNKQSCRECGTELIPHLRCSTCNEYSSWVCSECGRMEDYDHASCRRQVIVAKS